MQMQNINELIASLRHYRKTDIRNTGSELLWNVFRNKNNYPVDRVQIINAYAPKLIMLGLATANDYRNINLNSVDFYNLCHDLLGVKDSISDQDFLLNESIQIVEILKNRTGKNKIIPDMYLDQKIIREICSILFISRSIRQQHEIFLAGTNEFYMTYDVLVRLNEYTEGLLDKNFRAIFDTTPLHYMRAAFGLFALGNDKNKNGKILFKGLTCDDEVKKKLEIDIEICKSAASKISCKESILREWYQNEVLVQQELYQKYYPTPLYRLPIVEMDLSRDIDYFIPSPGLYIRGIREGIFSQICTDKKIASRIGDAVADHIFEGLKSIFGEDKVSKIPESKDMRSADFQIDLENCVLIVECKSGAGAHSDLSIMSPQHIADIWSRLYDACSQCAASMRNLTTENKPIIPIVLVASHITAETLPFQTYAVRSDIFKDMNIEHIEFMSWDSLQYGLSKSSVDKFTAKILERKNNSRATIQEVMSFDLERDKPAHNYDFLKEREHEIFGKNFG